MLSLTEKILLTPWALQQGIKVYWVEHDRIGHWLTWNPWLPILCKLSKNVTTFVVSEFSRKLYLNLGWPPEKTVAIPNGVNLPSPNQPSPQSSPFKGRGRTEGEGGGGGKNLHIGC